MSIFRPGQYRDMPDILPDPQPKNRLIVFFEVYYRKFWRFIAVNLIFFLAALPMFVIFYAMANGYIARITGETDLIFLPGAALFASWAGYLPPFSLTVSAVVSAVLYGPLKMGIAYVFRCFSEEKHAYISDVFSRAQSNFKQGVIFGIIDVTIALILLFNIFGDFSSITGVAYTLLYVSKYASVVLLAVYAFARHYVYLMAVTVDLGVFAIVKNSLICAVLALGKDFTVSFICMAAWAVTLLTVPLVTLIALPLFTYSFCGFISVFISYPVIEKYIINRIDN